MFSSTPFIAFRSLSPLSETPVIQYLLSSHDIDQEKEAPLHSAYHPHGHDTTLRMHNDVRIRTESGEDSAKLTLLCVYGALIPHIR